MLQYLPFFQTLYDEKAPVGHLGRGTHYSVLRSLTWVDNDNQPLQTAAIHDFAVIWDEDHDIRVTDVVHKLYCRGLLGAALFVAERKGTLTYLVDDAFLQCRNKKQLDDFKSTLGEVAQPNDEDWWPIEIGSIEQSLESSIIHAPAPQVEIYLKNICQLWSLGIKPIGP